MTIEEENESCRRKFFRFETDTLVWWSKDWEPEPIALLDISAGGMLCEFPSPLENNTKISLHFEFPGHDGLILCKCKVVHCRADEGSFYMVGLKILELEGMDQLEFIQRLKDGLPREEGKPGKVS